MHLKTLGTPEHNQSYWEVILHDKFVPEFWDLSKQVRVELAALTLQQREKGPLLGRPAVDTLKGSRYTNMKELRFGAGGGGGAWHLPSILRGEQFCSWLGTKQVCRSSDSTPI